MSKKCLSQNIQSLDCARRFMCIEEIKCTMIPRNCIRANQKLWLCVEWLLDDVMRAMLYVTFQLDFLHFHTQFVYTQFSLIHLNYSLIKCPAFAFHTKHSQRNRQKNVQEKCPSHIIFSLVSMCVGMNVYSSLHLVHLCQRIHQGWIKLKGNEQHTEHGIDEIMSFQINFTWLKWLLTCSFFEHLVFPLFECSSNTRNDFDEFCHRSSYERNRFDWKAC